MNTKKHTKSAATSVAGNIVGSWIKFNRAPENSDNLNQLADALDAALRIKLQDGTIGGGIRGLEADIRQDAALLLLSNYLAGNSRLREATSRGNREAIANELDRSMNAALSIQRRRIISRIVIGRNRFMNLEEEDPNIPAAPSASGRGFWQLPYPVQHLLALKMLLMAVSEQRITKQAAEVVAEMLEENLTQAELARKRGVSRSAISQNLKAVRKALKTMLPGLEDSLP